MYSTIKQSLHRYENLTVHKAFNTDVRIWKIACKLYFINW